MSGTSPFPPGPQPRRSGTATAREEVLARIRTALTPSDRPEVLRGDRPPDEHPPGGPAEEVPGGHRQHGEHPPGGPGEEVPRAYRTRGEHQPGDPALLDLLADRLVDYRAGVRRANKDGVAAAVGEALAEGLRRADGREPGRAARVIVPTGLPRAWLAESPAEAVVDEGQDADALDDLDGVVTAAAVAIAETGTIVLDASSDQGRRAITLVPDLHVCVVRADQIVAAVPEALPRLDPTRPLTWISGPSATSDIELNRVEGVHGPRTLEVILVTG